MQAVGSIDKQKLTRSIKADLYCLFVYEMGIMSKDFKNIAQGNANLEVDLQNLYAAFNKGEDEAQKQLDAFCVAWQLDAITLR